MLLSLYKDLLPIHDVQALPQRIDALALEVIDGSTLEFFNSYIFLYSRRLRLKLPRERLIAVLNRHGIAAFRVGRNVDVEADDAACVDVLLINGLARLVGDAYLIGFIERIEIDAQLLAVVFAVERLRLCLSRRPRLRLYLDGMREVDYA